MSSNGTKNRVKERFLRNLVIHEKFLSINHRMLFPDLTIDWFNLYRPKMSNNLLFTTIL
jgi:hypothetical protein